jgi:hypothetical protein
MDQIINKVSESGIITFNLEDYYPAEEEVFKIDLKDLLFQGLILKEKDLRDWVKQFDPEKVKHKYVWITCSTDAVIQTWAYMLIAQKLCTTATKVILGSNLKMVEEIIEHKISQLDLDRFNDQRVVVKGCSKKQIPDSLYVYVTNTLTPIVKSLMFGEPCSTVPLFKKK